VPGITPARARGLALVAGLKLLEEIVRELFEVTVAVDGVPSFRKIPVHDVHDRANREAEDELLPLVASLELVGEVDSVLACDLDQSGLNRVEKLLVHCFALCLCVVRLTEIEHILFIGRRKRKAYTFLKKNKERPENLPGAQRMSAESYRAGVIS